MEQAALQSRLDNHRPTAFSNDYGFRIREAASQVTGAPMAYGDSWQVAQAIMDHVHFGLAVVGPDNKVLFANQAAQRECLQGSVLRSRGGYLIVAQPAEAGAFRRALEAARSGRWSLVQLSCGSERLALALVPLNQLEAGIEPPVLLVFGTRYPCKALAIQFYARSCGMTAAEERVLQALSEGLAPRAVARRHEVSLSTVRTQLRSIRSKSGACSVSELMRTLGCLPPIMPAGLRAI